jgi:hypothetical protein
MKKLSFIITFSIFILSYYSCSNRCSKVSREDFGRPPLKEDYLKWVQLKDTLPKFRYTVFNEGGDTLSMDTIQGYYVVEYSQEQFLPDPSCEHPSFCPEAYLTLSFDNQFNNLGIFNLELNNCYRKEGFEATVLKNSYEKKFNESTALDTLITSNRIFINVCSADSFSLQSLKFYYAKEIGFVKINYFNSLLELL